jgi:hypothetical protein
MITPQFLTAGKAIFTVANPQGVHYTYKVTKKDPRPTDTRKTPVYFIKLLTGGPDNTSSYTYLGMLNPTDGQVILTRASKFQHDSLPVKVANWFIGFIYKVQREPLLNHTLPVGYKLAHAGRCGRCGRLLTTPDSIELGFGPECAGLLNLVDRNPRRRSSYTGFDTNEDLDPDDEHDDDWGISPMDFGDN